MTNANFSTTAAFDRSRIRRKGGSVRYLSVQVRAAGPKTTERVPMNIALVIDASGSMSNGKLEAAKSAALGLSERLTDDDRLTVVSFASDVQVHLDAVPVTSKNKKRIRSEITKLSTRGMTHLSGGWFSGVEATAKIAEESPKMTPRVIILSDGHANEGITDQAELFEHASALRERGVFTSTLGIGDCYDEQLLRGIAENGGGRLHDAEHSDEISDVLLGELEDIFATVVEDAVVSLTAPPDVEIEALTTVRMERHGGQMIVRLGSLQNDIQRALVFKVSCPEIPEGQDLSFGVTASGRSVSIGEQLTANTPVLTLVSVKGSELRQQDRDMVVVATTANAWSACIVSTAARMNRDGAFREAEEYIQTELKHFQRYVRGLENGPELLRRLERLSRNVGARLSSRAQKEMVFQSALSMESRMDWRGAEKADWSAHIEEPAEGFPQATSVQSTR